MRKLWTRTLEATMLAFLLAGILLCVTLLMTMQGCVSTGFDFESSEDLEAGRVVRSIDPTSGKPITTTFAPRTKTTKRRANYTDTRAVGQAAGAIMDQAGGLGGILSTIPGGGLVGAGVAILGGLGLIHKKSTDAAKLSGKEEGYTQHQIESGIIVNKGAS